MSKKDSRTTKKARALLPDAHVVVAIPAVVRDVDGEPAKSSLGQNVKALVRGSSKSEKVIALASTGTIVMDSKSSNGAIPEAVVAQTTSFPTVVSNGEDGLIIELDNATYRIGQIHSETMMSVISAVEAGVALSPEPDSTPPIEESVTASEPEELSVDVVDAVEASEPEADSPTTEVVEATPAAPIETPPKKTTSSRLSGRLGSATASWSDAFERYLFSETPDEPVHIERRSRTTLQCQRLLSRNYGNPLVHLAVPGKAQPREGTEDPKGPFIIAFTEQGAMLFKPSRGNEARPLDVLGPIDSSPTTFEESDYAAREGGVLTVGGRRYAVPRAYVGSLAEYLEEHHSSIEPSETQD